MIVYVMITTELFIKYFYNIKLCCCEDVMRKCVLFTEKLFVFKYCLYLLFKGRTPLHLSSESGKTDVTKVLLEADASLSAVDMQVINPSVKLRQ